MYANRQSCEKALLVEKRNFACATLHFFSTLLPPSDDDEKSLLFASINLENFFPHLPLVTRVIGYLSLHSFHNNLKSLSGTNPYLCPYQSISIESRCSLFDVHGSAVLIPTKLIFFSGNFSLCSTISIASVGT